MIQAASAVGAGILLRQTIMADKPEDKPLRFVHLTDMHVAADGPGPAGFAAALAAVGRLDPPPQFIITGGDHVMETLDCPREKALAQWSAYHKTLTAGTNLRIYPVLGNHDIWGWGLKDPAAQTAPAYGKQMALDQLALRRAYYSFDAASWHFIVLDSQTRRGNGYYAALDPAQLEWLRADLAALAKHHHICILSHIPILAACVFFDGERLRPDSWHVPDAWMHRDAPDLLALLRTHPVRLAISGHIHLLDRVAYNGLTFICDGAVSGNWWKGPYHETPEGFGVFDLCPDGRFTHSYVDFGWKAQGR